MDAFLNREGLAVLLRAGACLLLRMQLRCLLATYAAWRWRHAGRPGGSAYGARHQRQRRALKRSYLARYMYARPRSSTATTSGASI